MDFLMDNYKTKGSKLKSREYLSSVELDLTRCTMEEVFNQLYDAENFDNFLSTWLLRHKCKSKNLAKGSTVDIRFFIPFYYKLTVVNVYHNKGIHLITTGGMLIGEANILFTNENNKATITFEFSMKGINRLAHIFYFHLLYPGHEWYMKWRYKKLKKALYSGSNERIDYFES